MKYDNSLPEPWRTLAERFGSVKALAEHFGVTRRTINRWANGEMGMSGPAKKLLESLKTSTP